MYYSDRGYSVGLEIHEEGFYGNFMNKQGKKITEGPLKYSEQGVQNYLGFLPSNRDKRKEKKRIAWWAILNIDYLFFRLRCFFIRLFKIFHCSIIVSVGDTLLC